jgi:hypothetical protein
LLRDVSLQGNNTLKGTITNNSKFSLRYLEFEVTVTDCQKSEGSETVDCQTVGQTTVGKFLAVPPFQTREFGTTALVFKNMPQQKPCWDNATSTRGTFIFGGSESDKEAYNLERGRRFLHISSFRRMTPAEMVCDHVRSFVWELTQIEAAVGN